MPYGTVNADKMTTSDGISSSGLYGFKNRIINGGMVIDQRNLGASLTASVAGTFTYTLDRWGYQASQASKFTVQQNAGSVTPPAGFSNYLGVTSLSAYSVGASDYFLIGQNIEGFNAADFAFGTANALAVTLSFWVRSSLTGTFGGSLQNSANTRSYPFSYTINSANTWELKTVTISGDTSGTWIGATNGIGLRVYFGLGIGSSFSGTAGAWAGANAIAPTGAQSVVGTNGATFYITGVQLEKGSTATSFDYRPFGTEFELCRRYYRTSFPYGTTPAQNAGQQGALATQAASSSANTVSVTVQVNPPMRTNPGTITYYNPSAANANWRNTSNNSDGGVVGQVNGASTGWMVFMNSTPSASNTYQIHYSAEAEL